jgi:hypothetical protein
MILPSLSPTFDQVLKEDGANSLLDESKTHRTALSKTMYGESISSFVEKIASSRTVKLFFYLLKISLNTQSTAILVSLIISAAFSPIIMTGAFVFPDVTLGIIDASTTRSRSTP